MKLEGSLDAFGLPDVFTLLESTKKTGALWIHRGSGTAERGVVYLVDGAVTGASIDPSHLGLLRRLVARGIVDEHALQAAAEHATTHGTGLVPAIVAGGEADTDDVVDAAEEQTVEAVFELLHWPEGEFSFTADEVEPDDVGLRLAVGSLVDQARSRQLRWDSAAVHVPSPDSVAVLAAEISADVHVSPAEWRVLALVDGRRAVGEIVELTGLGPFVVVCTLADLAERGVVAVGDANGTGPADAVRRRLDLIAVLAAAESDANGQVADSARPSAAEGARPNRLLGGAHAPSDVVPPRPEPFLPRRRPEHADVAAATNVLLPSPGTATVVGATAVADEPLQHDEPLEQADPDRSSPSPGSSSVASRDPALNRSMVLRLIAGVRGL